MRGVSFEWRCYEAPSPTWDHDHCEFCGAKFMELDHPEILREGWATPDPTAPGCFRWVCNDCFRDFREELDLQPLDGP